MQTESPLNAIPPVVIALFAVLAGIEAVFNLAAIGILGGQAGIGWRINALGDYAFSPAVWDTVVQGTWSPDLLKRFVTYPFVHGTVTHAIFGAVLLLAMGKFVGDVFNPLAVLAVFVASTVVGAVAFGLLVSGNPPLYGVYPPVYGLIGAFTFILWTRLSRRGGNQLQAFRLIGVLMALQLVFGLLFGSQPSWVADIAGFVTGFGLSMIVAPGGWQAVLTRLRTR
jgi:rhomboid protease GluP